MQCNKIREMLSAYIDGILDPHETSELEQHVRTCGLCHQELTALQETVRLLNSLGEVDPPGEFRSQLMQKLKAAGTAGGKDVRDDGPKSFGFRQLFGGINKFMTAAVLMISLGIGTGLYQAGMLTGYQAFDFSARTSQKSQVTGNSEDTTKFKAAAPKMARGVPEESGRSESAEIAETPPAESKDRAPQGTGATSPGNQGASKALQGANGAAPQGFAALSAPDQAKSTPGPEQSTVSSNEITPEAAREKILSSPVSNVAEGQAESQTESLRGSSAGSPASPPAAEEAQPARDSMLLAQKNDSPGPLQLQAKSDNGPSQQDGWVFPALLVAVGMALAGYYAGLRRSKKS